MGRNSSVGTRTTSTGLSEGAFPAEITSIEAIERREAGGSGIVVGLRCRLDPDSGAPQIGDGISTLFEGDDSISGKVSYGAMEVEFTGVNTGAHEAKIRLRPSKGGVLANDVIISPDGYLGLGNQDPTSILHIFAPSTALASNQILVTNANAKVWTYQHGSPSNDDWSLGSTDAGTVLYIEQDTGQVGINRTDPGYTVDIATATNVGLNIDGSGQASGQPTQIRLVDGDSAVTTLSAVAGKMGINTSSPDFALQVNAGASQVVSEFYGTTASSFLSIASSSEAISNNTGIAFSAYPGGVLGSYCSTAYIQSYVVQSSPTLKGNLIFVTNSGDQTYEAMRIDENQNVGIGTNAPTSPGGIDKFLHIYSNTHAGLILEDTSHSPWTMWTQNGELMYSYSSTEYMKLQAGGHLHTRDFGTYEVGTSVGATHNIQIYPQAKRAVYVWILHCSVGGGNQSAPYDEMHQASWHGFLWRDITETGYTEFHSPGGDGVSFGDRSIGIGSPSAASSYVNLQATVGSNTTGVLKIMWMGYLEKLAIDSSTVYTTPT